MEQELNRRELERYLERVTDRWPVQRALLAGARVDDLHGAPPQRERGHEYVLVLVSEHFDGVPWLERVYQAGSLWDALEMGAAAEVHCYTPAEFERKREQLKVVRAGRRARARAAARAGVADNARPGSDADAGGRPGRADALLNGPPSSRPRDAHPARRRHRALRRSGARAQARPRQAPRPLGAQVPPEHRRRTTRTATVTATASPTTASTARTRTRARRTTGPRRPQGRAPSAASASTRATGTPTTTAPRTARRTPARSPRSPARRSRSGSPRAAS